MSTTAYQSPGGARPPALAAGLRRPMNTGQAGCSTADLLARRRRYLDPGLRRTFGAAYVNALLAEIDRALAERALGGAA